ncbi:uncharacterized protein LOC141667840 isoform X1 [Apium graveolens]|uniref:uncharacterized protein LOC141667840 isoform X1 n=2 Tax=Apium graveolens TaxID=4045 RepID=UPI003D7A9E15
MSRLVPFLRQLGTTNCNYLFSSSILHFHSTPPSFFSTPYPHVPLSDLQQQLLVYSKSGFNKLDDALNMFDEMLKTRPLLPIINFNQLLSALLKMKHYSVAVSLFSDICYLRIPLNVITFSVAINCCCYAHRLDYAFSLLGSIFKRGLVPDSFVYNILIRGLLSQGKSDEAEALFKKIILFKEIEPDVVTFTTMINGLAKSGHANMALWLFNCMEDNDCQPNKFTYSTVIHSLCKRGLVDEALKLHSKMEAKGIVPDIMTFTPIIKGLCISKKWEEASKVLKHMIDDINISPNVYTFNIFVDAYAKAGKLEDAKRIIQIMDESGKYPDIITYNSLLQAYCLQGQIEGGLAVLSTMALKKIIPDCYTYNILLHGLCQVGKPVEALTFFYKVRGQGSELDYVTYGTLLDGLCKIQYIDRALSFFKVMKCNGVIPDMYTYNIIISGCLRNKKYNEACGLIDEMLDHSFLADALTTSLLQNLLSLESQDPIILAMYQKCLQSGNHKEKHGVQISKIVNSHCPAQKSVSLNDLPYVEFSSLDRITSIKVEEAMPEVQVNLANIDSDANVGDTD